MANIANLTLKDAAGVNVVFTPLSVDPGVLVKWQSPGPSGIRVGYQVASLGQRSPNADARSSKVTIMVVQPTLEVTAGSTGSGYQAAPKVAYTVLGKAEFVMHERSTLTERQNILAAMKAFLNDATVASAIATFDLPT